MGREIRRVPPDWEHPEDERGRYKSLYDNDYESAAREWEANYAAAMLLTPTERADKFRLHYWEYDAPPDADTYRERAWTEAEATAYQIYENVSEGSPVSPVFANKDAMRDWLIGEGYSAHAADDFIEQGWAFSMMIANGRVFEGIHTCEV
jgi:hypothetical protein